jgi:hypothetical protein
MTVTVDFAQLHPAAHATCAAQDPKLEQMAATTKKDRKRLTAARRAFHDDAHPCCPTAPTGATSRWCSQSSSDSSTRSPGSDAANPVRGYSAKPLRLPGAQFGTPGYCAHDMCGARTADADRNAG